MLYSRKKILTFYFLIIFSIVFFFHPGSMVKAATLTTVSDTITTSRPSASSPLTSDQAANATQETVVDNGSIYLASDSAQIRPDTGETANTNNSNVASMSASISSTRIVYFTDSNAVNTRHKGDPVVVANTATHTIKFTTVTNIPASGKITLTFPALTAGDANVAASPSATTFQMNGLSSTNIKVVQGTTDVTTSKFITGGSITVTNPSSGTSPTVVLTLNSSNTIAAGSVMYIFLGCTAVDTTPKCTTQSPSIINPTKTAASGTADKWNLSITTRDVTGGVDLDTANVKIGTVESVFVQANIDSSFTFTIAGINNATALNQASYCGASHNVDTTNSGYNTTATDVNLGTVSSAASNSAAQLLTIISNAINGYTITATSSGHFLNPGSGFFLSNAQGDATANDTPSPATMTVGTAGFGITACDANGKVNTNTWGQSPDKFANPSMSFYYTLVNSATQPAASGDPIVVLYRATAAGATPPGVYRTTLTYVATPIF